LDLLGFGCAKPETSADVPQSSTTAEQLHQRDWPGTTRAHRCSAASEDHMNSVIYLIGLVVVLLAILSFIGMA
jgi:hypothetical protein